MRSTGIGIITKADNADPQRGECHMYHMFVQTAHKQNFTAVHCFLHGISMRIHENLFIQYFNLKVCVKAANQRAKSCLQS